MAGALETLVRYMVENGIDLNSPEGRLLMEEYMLLADSAPAFSYSILDFDGNGQLDFGDRAYITSMWGTTANGTCYLENMYNRYRVVLSADD